MFLNIEKAQMKKSFEPFKSYFYVRELLLFWFCVLVIFLCVIVSRIFTA